MSARLASATHRCDLYAVAVGDTGLNVFVVASSLEEARHGRFLDDVRDTIHRKQEDIARQNMT